MIRWTVPVMLLCAMGVRADDWPQWLGAKRDGILREPGLIETFPEGGLKPVWRMPLGAGYSGPAVADGRVFVMARTLERNSANPASSMARSAVKGNEEVVALDAKTGKSLWKFEYPCEYRISYAAGPRCTPTVDGELLYALGAMGDLHCLKVKTGEVVWKKNFLKDYGAELPVWGFSSHPLIEGDTVICIVGGSEGRGVVAFDKKTGAEVWKSVETSGDVGYCPPTILKFGPKEIPILVIWHSKAVCGLVPGTGKVLWTMPFDIRFALTAPTPIRYESDKLFVTSFYNGSRMYRIAEDGASATLLWSGKSNSEQPTRTDGLHSIIATPYIVGKYIYGVCSYGEMRCLEADTGKRVWQSYEGVAGQSVRWGNSFLTPVGDKPDRWLIFNEKGELILAKLGEVKYVEIGRTKLIEPTNNMPGRPVVWMHPAYANKCIFVRNDKEIVCYSLAK